MGSVLSLLGAGGSILTMPVLVYLFSIPAVEATSYSLLIVGLTALLGSIGYFRQGTIDIKTAIIFGIPSILGVLLARHSKCRNRIELLSWAQQNIPDEIR